MKRVPAIPFIFILVLSLACSDQKEPFSLTFTGDVILARGVSDKLNIYGDSLLSHRLKPLLQGSLASINLETVLTMDSIPQTRGYALRADTALAMVLREAGVDVAFTDNNHAGDFGDRGKASTEYHLKKAGLHGSTAFSRKLKGRKAEIITAALFPADKDRPDQGGNALINQVRTRAEEDGKRPIILYLHWGVEYQSEPTESQRKLAHGLIDAGADAVIGHHPHVFQRIEFYRHKPIVYSLGNFVADAYLPGTTQGAIATLPLTDTLGHIRIKPIDLSDYFPGEMSTKEEMAFFQRSLALNDSICYLIVDDTWQLREASLIDFREDADSWLFSLGRGRMLSLRPLQNKGYKLTTFIRGEFQNSMALYGSLSQLVVADVDNDGRTELILNISKRVDFDDRFKNRVNIFDIDAHGTISTQWLGTKFLRDLVSFEVVNIGAKNYLKTIETDDHSRYENLYEWDEFGFALSELNDDQKE